MLSIVIPTLNAEPELPQTLASLVDATMAGLVRQVVVVDGGSADRTVEIADEMGATVIHAEPGRGRQLALGATAAKCDWILFLHADTRLEPGWDDEVKAFIPSHNTAGARRAAAFAFKLDDRALGARFLEWLVRLRCRLFALPYGDQGLLIHRQHYDQIGGYSELPLMEDVDIVRRIGRRRLRFLGSRAITSARRYRKEGYLIRPLRNALILSLYFLRVPPRLLVRLYG